MENFNQAPHIERNDFDEEMIFESIIKSEIIDAVIEDLEEAEFEKEEIDEFLSELKELDESSIKGVLSMPQELRRKNFPISKQRISKGEITIKDWVANLSEMARKNNFTIGYHVSKTDIPMQGEKWEIKATEVDDRDDRKMAYYSLDHKNLYRADRGTKLYVVRAETGENSSHKKDNKNNWSRANSLSIVCKADLPTLDMLVEKKLKEIRDAA